MQTGHAIDTSVFDPSEVQERLCGGLRQCMKQVLESFDVTLQLQAVHAAEAAKDAQALHDAAHALKGAVSYLMAHQTAACARALCEAALESREAAAWHGPQVRQLVGELCRQLERVERNRRAVLLSMDASN